MIKKIIFEPLVHFLLLGILFYLYYNSTQTEKVTLKIPIYISSYEIQELKLEYGQNLNKEVLDALVQKKYYEKVLLDKAYSIKLAQNDPLITKRLLKQMEFVMTDKTANKEPSEKELTEYYQKNIQDYSNTSSLSFFSIYFKNTQSKQLTKTYKLLTLTNINPENAHFFGEKSILGNEMKNITPHKSQELFGRYFTRKLFTLKKGIWHKAIRCKDGVRIVFVTQKNVTNPEIFDEVQGRVYNDFLDERLRNIKKNSFKKIAATYTLKSDSIETH